MELIPNEQVNLIKSSFVNVEMLKQFQKKYKNVYSKISIEDHAQPYLKLVEDLMTMSPEVASSIVKDFGSIVSFNIKFRLGVGMRYCLLQQMPGLCGAVYVTNFSSMEIGDSWEALFDVAELMGYRMMFLSQRATDEGRAKKEALGFTRYLNFTNRRTLNNIDLYYKLLNTYSK